MKDFIPVLSGGEHRSAEEGACLMEMVSFMNGSVWSDRPECTADIISYVAQCCNDRMSDETRYLLLSQFDRLFGTADANTSVMFKVLVQEYLKGAAENRGNLRELVECHLEKGDYYMAVYAVITSAVPNLEHPDRSKVSLKVLKDVLDIYDKVMVRETVEKQDLSVLAKLPGQLV